MMPVLSSWELDVPAERVHLLLRSVWKSTIDEYQSSTEWQEAATQGRDLLTSVENHKKPFLIVNGKPVVLVKANSDRPAFITFTETSGNGLDNVSDSMISEELLYLYPAMGLTHQHDSQQMLLAYANTMPMVASLRNGAKAMLQVRFYVDTISYPTDFPE